MKITDELIRERIDKYNEENEGITLNDKLVEFFDVMHVEFFSNYSYIDEEE